ncbi:BRO1-like domain-containing protein [Scheffersomyces xylosifermentans]|uniref:BRO1-like domain-containing protein n=1 Tax=Scheffersomyces xylosifermentans TaxID=1304137 RepID=UPI00315DB899
MKTHLLVIPTKKAEEVNWTKPLNNYLLSIYGTTSEYSEDLGAFNKLRQDIRGVNADKTGIRLYYKYYSQVELLDLRIPFGSVNKHKKITFEWYDAFHPTTSHKQGALPFEKANVLFNLGALLSKYASIRYEESQRSVSGSDEASTKESIQLLQQAAGIYQFLNENFLHAPSLDLHQNTVRFLVKLMLAQAQEVFVLTVISGDLEGKKNSLIAKLCRSASVHYEECYNMVAMVPTTVGSNFNDFAIVDSEPEEGFLEHPENEDEGPEENSTQVVARLDSTWVPTVRFKMYFYKSLAYYFNGMQLEATRKYGEALAYYTKSKEILDEITSHNLKGLSKPSSSEGYDLLDNFKYQKDAIGIKLTDLTKDNDLIYHDIIPSLVTLPDIKPLDSTKSIPITQNAVFQEINESNYNNFLNNVVPINIHELSSFYSEEKSQFLRNELDAVDVSNEETSSVLEYLKLPKALVTIKELISTNVDHGSLGQGKGIRIDPRIEGIASEIASEYQNDLKHKDRIAQLRKDIYENIASSEKIASQQVSESLNKYKEDLIKLKKSLYDATNSDTKLLAMISDNWSSIYATLGQGPNSDAFKNLFKAGPTKSPSDKPEVSLLDLDESQQTAPTDKINAQIKVIEDILHDLNVIKSNKSKLIETLKTQIHNDDISDILILNSKMKSSNEIKTIIFPEELKKFQPYNEDLDKLIEKEKSFLADLKAEWNKLSSNPEIKNIQSSKVFEDQLIADQSSKISTFYNDIWKKYSVGLKKGADFYFNLLSYAINLKENIQIEAERAAIKPRGSLSENFSGLNLNNDYGSQQQLHPQQSYGYSNQQPPPPSRPHQGSYFSGAAPNISDSYRQQAAPPVAQASRGSFSQYSQAQAPNPSSYSRPPPLPPKTLEHQTSGPPLPPQPQQYSQAPSQAYGSPQPSNTNQYNLQPPADSSNPNGNPNDLIYNQPSKYSPNMYQFFSNN